MTTRAMIERLDDNSLTLTTRAAMVGAIIDEIGMCGLAWELSCHPSEHPAVRYHLELDARSLLFDNHEPSWLIDAKLEHFAS